MAMRFEELDALTRKYMLAEFEVEISGPAPYLSKLLSGTGRAAFPDLMRAAINEGNEETLAASLCRLAFWKSAGASGQVNVVASAKRLAITEFNTWYVRGFAKRLIDEGVTKCQAYRAAEPMGARNECTRHEGQIFEVEEIYRNHRARYWPTTNNVAVSIPFSPNCHHTIRRV